MNRLAKFLVKHSRLALFGFIALVALSSIGGFQAIGALKGGGYDDQTSASAKVVELNQDIFNKSDPEVIVIADFASELDSPQSVADGKALAEKLAAVDGVKKVTDFYSLGRPNSLRSEDDHATYFFVNIADSANHAKVAGAIADDFTGEFKSAKIYVAGFAAATSEINHTIEHDIATAEAVAVPLTLILLVFVFGSIVAAGLPVLVGALSIVGALFFVWLSTLVTDTSIFALNLVTGLGLGLGIDYALLMVNRFREERNGGHSVNDAVVRTVRTAGRTVLFSGLTVGVVLSALFFFPQYFLRSFALGGVAVVLLSIASALIALPAALKLIGDGINRGRLGGTDLNTRDIGLWSRIANIVMKRPVAVLLVTVIGLGGLFSLSSGVVFGQVDDRVLPANNRIVVASNLIRERFSGREGSPIEIVMKGVSADDVTDYVIELSKIDDIVRVQSTVGMAQSGELDQGYAPAFADYKSGEYQRVIAIHDVESRSSAGIELTKKIREINSNGHSIWVGGSAAIYTDSQAGIERQLPWAAGWVVVWTLLLLFLFTGSVLLPIKAVVLNALSLGATLGFVTWVFMQGHLQWFLGEFTTTGSIDTSTTVLIAVVVFGLSMDYELFLLSRIKEQHDRGLGTTESVSVGLQRSGRIITAAALVLAFSFAAFATSGVSIMKMMGLGISFAILLDATVVRALLVPALMRLFGEANWWAPKWLRKIYRAAKLDH